MVDKKKVALSYIFIFMGVYLLFISYSMLSKFIDYEFSYSLPQSEAMNATSNAVSSISSSPISWLGIVIITGVGAIILGLISQAFMRQAVG